MGPNALRLIILLFSARDAIAVPHLFERQGEGLLGDDWLGNAGADFPSGAKIPDLLNNPKEFVMPSPQPDPTAGLATDAVEANPPAKGQDLDSIPGGVSRTSFTRNLTRRNGRNGPPSRYRAVCRGGSLCSSYQGG